MRWLISLGMLLIVILMTCNLQAQQPVDDAPAAKPISVLDSACCQGRAIAVPIATYIVDIGLPLLMLLISYLVIRHAFYLCMQCHSSQMCYGLELSALERTTIADMSETPMASTVNYLDALLHSSTLQHASLTVCAAEITISLAVCFAPLHLLSLKVCIKV